MTTELEQLCSRVVQCASATMTRVIIMQGTPGSGKTTVATMLAKRHPNAVVVSADDYFMNSGVYTFDPSKLSLAHESCRNKARDALFLKKAVIVDNCNATRAQVQDYMTLANLYSFTPCIVHMKCSTQEAAVSTSTRSVHNVPAHAVKRCHTQMERLTGNYITHNVS
jgi:predicted kinase